MSDTAGRSDESRSEPALVSRMITHTLGMNTLLMGAVITIWSVLMGAVIYWGVDAQIKKMIPGEVDRVIASRIGEITNQRNWSNTAESTRDSEMQYYISLIINVNTSKQFGHLVSNIMELDRRVSEVYGEDWKAIGKRISGSFPIYASTVFFLTDLVVANWNGIPDEIAADGRNKCHIIAWMYQKALRTVDEYGIPRSQEINGKRIGDLTRAKKFFNSCRDQVANSKDDKNENLMELTKSCRASANILRNWQERQGGDVKEADMLCDQGKS